MSLASCLISSPPATPGARLSNDHLVKRCCSDQQVSPGSAFSHSWKDQPEPSVKVMTGSIGRTTSRHAFRAARIEPDSHNRQSQKDCRLCESEDLRPKQTTTVGPDRSHPMSQAASTDQPKPTRKPLGPIGRHVAVWLEERRRRY